MNDEQLKIDYGYLGDVVGPHIKWKEEVQTAVCQNVLRTHKKP